MRQLQRLPSPNRTTSPKQGLPLHRSGFTLTEILVATMILAIMSTVMLSALFTATRVYESGERAKNTSDEAMIVMATLQRDFSKQVPPADGGEFIAEKIDNHNCRVAWTIRDAESNRRQKTSLVEWHLDSNYILRRRTFDDVDHFRAFQRNTPNNPSNNRSPRSQQDISANILHFGVWVADRSDALPDDHTWWTMRQTSNADARSLLVPPINYYDPENNNGASSEDFIEFEAGDALRRFPYALRITLLVAGGKRVQAGSEVRFSGEGRLTAPLRPMEYREVRASGAGQFRAGPGSLALIGSGNAAELVGYHELSGQRLVLNSHLSNSQMAKPYVPGDSTCQDFAATDHQKWWQDGPLGITQNANTPPELTGGRGVFRSPIGDHDRNTPIRYGTLFIMNRVLLR
jgi:prepilin-type N-terminal cleavage/methylation domain-containing protein